MFLGVDGGGTKTAYALVDAEGTAAREPRRRERGSSSRRARCRARSGWSRASKERLRWRRSPRATSSFAFLGLPAHGEDSGRHRGARCHARRRFSRPIATAAATTWSAAGPGSLACADGISVIAGTGSMAYGEYAGRQARCGGWGELIGDEGSAYWIAREGMNLFSRMSDGRAARGPLHGLVRDRLGLANDLFLCSRIYGARADRRDAFAQFARLVHDAAQAGDRDGRGHLHARRRANSSTAWSRRTARSASPQMRPCPCRTAAACSTTRLRWSMRSAPASLPPLHVSNIVRRGSRLRSAPRCTRPGSPARPCLRPRDWKGCNNDAKRQATSR